MFISWNSKHREQKPMIDLFIQLKFIDHMVLVKDMK